MNGTITGKNGKISHKTRKNSADAAGRAIARPAQGRARTRRHPEDRLIDRGERSGIDAHSANCTGHRAHWRALYAVEYNHAGVVLPDWMAE